MCTENRSGVVGLNCAWLIVLAFVVLGLSGCSRSAQVGSHLRKAERLLAERQFDLARLEYLQVLKLDPRQPDALYHLGILFYDRGQVRQAFAAFVAAQAARPNNVDLDLRVIHLSLESNQAENARTGALAVLKKDRKSEEALIYLARSSLTTNQVQDAEAVVQEFRSENGEGAGVHLALGYLALNKGDFSKAEREFSQALSLDPKRSSIPMALARLRWRQGDFRQADMAFEKAVGLEPDSWENRLEWADFKLRTGQVEAASQTAAELEKRVPQLQAARILRARAALAARNFDLGKQLVDSVLQAEPQNTDALLVQAQLALSKGAAAEAVKQFEALRDLMPNSATIRYQLALAFAGERKLTEARESVRKAIELNPNFLEALLLKAELDLQAKDFGSVVNTFEPLTRRAPKLARAFSLLGDAYRGQGRMAEAMAAYRRWEELAPNAPEPKFMIGIVLQEQGNGSQAQQEFEASSRMAPNSVLPVEKLVELDLQRKDVASALSRATSLASRTPKAPAPQLLLAKIHLEAHQTNEAEGDFKQAIQLNPDSGIAYRLLAQLYLHENRLDEALRCLENWVGRQPASAEALVQLGLVQERLGKYPEARESYERALQSEPSSAVALNNLAFLCTEHLNDLQAAYQYAQRARELAPDNPTVADTLGWVLCRRGDFAWALSLLRPAAEKLSRDPEVQFHLGCANYMMGNETEALAALQRALDLKNDFAQAGEARARLAVLKIDPKTVDESTIDQLKRASAQDARDVMALVRLAEVAETHQQPEAALANYRQALQVNPKSVPLLLRMCKFYARFEKQPARALEMAKAARDLAPENLDVARALGESALLAGDFALSYRCLQNAFAAQPKDPVLLEELARASYGRGLVREATEFARQAVELGASLPSGRDAKEFLEMSEAAQDPVRADAADVRAERILQVRPHDIPALMVHGVALAHHRHLREAVQVFESVLQVAPQFAPASRELACYYLESELADARKSYEQGLLARRVFRDDAQLATWLGKAAYQLKDYEHAVQFLGEGLRGGSNKAEEYYELGMAQAGLRRSQESRLSLRKAVQLGLTGSALNEAQRVLQETGSASSDHSP